MRPTDLYVSLSFIYLSIMTSATCGAASDFPSESLAITPVFDWVRISAYLSWIILFTFIFNIIDDHFKLAVVSHQLNNVSQGESKQIFSMLEELNPLLDFLEDTYYSYIKQIMFFKCAVL